MIIMMIMMMMLKKIKEYQGENKAQIKEKGVGNVQYDVDKKIILFYNCDTHICIFVTQPPCSLDNFTT